MASAVERAFQHYRGGRFQEAGRVLDAALKLERSNPDLWILAGATAKALGHWDNAEHCWRRAIACAPGKAEAHYQLGLLLHERNRIEEAIGAYRTALERGLRHVQLLNNMGSALAKLGQPAEAQQYFEHAVSLDPGHAKAHHNLARVLGQLGRFDEAATVIEAAMALVPAPERARFFRTLTSLKKLNAGDAQLAAMEALALDGESLSGTEQMQLNFALGKAYEDIGDRERSLAHLLMANREKRRQTPYDEAATMARLDAIQAAYSRERMSARGEGGATSSQPVFIVGMPRSGSTLVEQILSSHPRVYGAGECEDFNRLAEAIRRPDGRPLLPDGINEVPENALYSLGQAYLAVMHRRAPQAARVTDKTLGNIVNVGLIHLALPGAKIIHTKRDAADTCLSCFSQLFSGHHPYAYDLAELGRYWKAYDRLMDHWKSVLPDGVMLEVRYEDVVEDLEGQARRLLDHCALEWSASCAAFHLNQRPVRTASLAQVREPIYRRSVHKWQASKVFLRPLLEVLGYPVDEAAALHPPHLEGLGDA